MGLPNEVRHHMPTSGEPSPTCGEPLCECWMRWCEASSAAQCNSDVVLTIDMNYDQVLRRSNRHDAHLGFMLVPANTPVRRMTKIKIKRRTSRNDIEWHWMTLRTESYQFVWLVSCYYIVARPRWCWFRRYVDWWRISANPGEVHQRPYFMFLCPDQWLFGAPIIHTISPNGYELVCGSVGRELSSME
jgi:hypothetical protein